MTISNFNIQTQDWMRMVVYDRLSAFKTMGVFVFSALWHGFHPGYYFTFLTVGLCTLAGRRVTAL
jgi:lysophospholipid acyltransferase 1/2